MARVAYGYNEAGDIDTAAAEVIRRIFAEFTRIYAHATLTEIAEGLNVDGIPTQRGGRWHASTVRYILRNQSYAAHGVIGEEMFNTARQRLENMKPGPPA